MAPRSGRSTSRKNTPLSPPKPAAVAESPRQTRAATRSQSRDVEETAPNAISKISVLAAVDEQPELNLRPAQRQPVLEPISADEDTDDSSSDSESVSDDSSDASSDHDDLDTTVMIDNLQSLYQDALDLLEILEVTDEAEVSKFHKQLHASNSTFVKKVHMRMKRLELSRAAFGQRLYLSPEKVAGTFFRSAHDNGDDNTDVSARGPWRPDLVLYLANLAQYLFTNMDQPEERILESHRYMYMQFPSPFMNAFNTENSNNFLGSNLLEETFQLDLDIRTQFFIAAAEAEELEPQLPKDLEQVLMDIFWDGDTPRGLTAFEPDVELDELPEIYEAQEARVTHLKNFFPIDSKRSVRVADMVKAFPVKAFLVNLCRWTSLRRVEIESQLKRLGGVANIVNRLEENDFSADPEDDPQVNEETAKTIELTLQKVEPSTTSTFSKNMSRFKQMKAAIAAVPSVRSTPIEAVTDPEPKAITTRQAQRVAAAEDDNILPLGSSPPLPSSPPRTRRKLPARADQTAIVMETLRKHKLQSEKENHLDIGKKKSFIDRQDGAQRLEFDDGQAEPSTAVSKRRVLANVEESEGSDDDFESDQRAPKRAHKRLRAVKEPEITTRTKQTRRIVDEGLFGLDDGDDNAVEPATQSRIIQQQQQSSRRSASQAALQPITRAPERSRQPQSATQVPQSGRPSQPRPRSPRRSQPQPSEPPRTQTSVANQKAKEVVQNRKILRMDQDEVYRSSRIQRREGYTVGEVDRLLELVAQYETKWAEILKADDRHPDGPRLQNRTQVQLKDKARNIKLDYLKAALPLPLGFQSVSIGARQIERLQGLGIAVDERAIRY